MVSASQTHLYFSFAVSLKIFDIPPMCSQNRTCRWQWKGMWPGSDQTRSDSGRSSYRCCHWWMV